ncbi:MAG: AMP-binding protein [Magnetococcales bacterium]|nr:AMP-binding protein [Magnetococcales bacterium]
MQTPPWLQPSDGAAAALQVAGQHWNYARLFQEGERISRALAEEGCGLLRLVAILGNHTAWAYGAIIAAHRLGYGYVPLNPALPGQRLANMVCQSQTRTIVVPEEGLTALEGLLLALSTMPEGALPTGEKPPFTWICPDANGFGDLPNRFPQHRYIGQEALDRLAERHPSPIPAPSSLAYLMFTSGSTGQPKGVPVTFANLTAYVEYWQNHHAIGPGDRVTQPADLSFDLSIHPIFVAWASGALLCPIPLHSRLAPAKFILDTRLTVWVSVPSVAMFLEKVNALQPGVFPSVRLSLFCGEPLPVRTAEAWRQATPQGRLLNLYGPTEATVAISAYEWQGSPSSAEARSGIVPIGWIFATQQGALLQAGEILNFHAGEGELCLAGSQVTGGYLHNPEKSAHHYIRTPATGETLWYRTGDWVQRREDGCLFFVRRLDHQIKWRGHRIELQEIDAVLRNACGHDFAVAIPWPVGKEGVEGLVACVAAAGSVDDAAILAACRRALPAYMVPTRIARMPQLPLNANGKIDREALSHSLTLHEPQGNR